MLTRFHRNCDKLSGNLLVHKMGKLFTVVLVFSSATLVITPAAANTCKAKRLKVKAVCGVVVDGSGVPIQGATLQLVSSTYAPLTRQVSTLSDGRFSIDDEPQGDLFLAINAPQHNPLRWPLKVTGKEKAGQCRKPLSVHLAGCLGCGCGDWVDQK